MKVIDKKPITQVIDASEFKYIDGRPCFAPDGNTVLFERSGSGITKAQFWSVNISSKDKEAVFYTSDTYTCLRADWSWNPNQKKNQIAFTANYRNGVSKIMLLDVSGASNSAKELVIQGYQANTRLSYPAWYPNESSLLITDYNALALLKATIEGEFLGVVSSGTKWAGMGAVSAKHPNVIAYAGQAINSNGYNQNINQIWIQHPGSHPALLSGKGTIGRGPWFSPDGKIMAYEGTDGVSNTLQIFLKKIGKFPYNKKAIPVSNIKNNSLHAKFSPDGTKVVWAENTAKGKAQIFIGTIIA
jgi:Tol biopolymer transport system component